MWYCNCPRLALLERVQGPKSSRRLDADTVQRYCTLRYSTGIGREALSVGANGAEGRERRYPVLRQDNSVLRKMCLPRMVGLGRTHRVSEALQATIETNY